MVYTQTAAAAARGQTRISQRPKHDITLQSANGKINTSFGFHQRFQVNQESTGIASFVVVELKFDVLDTYATHPVLPELPHLTGQKQD